MPPGGGAIGSPGSNDTGRGPRYGPSVVDGNRSAPPERGPSASSGEVEKALQSGPEVDDVGERDRPALLVSACLLGVQCNHRGAASPRPAVAALAGDYRLVGVCPEVEGGLGVPRPACEISPDGRVIDVDGQDRTEAYRRGAEVAVNLGRHHQVVGAVLKARSPSCGSAQVYDGSFTRTLVDGEGLAARALRDGGFVVASEEDVAAGHLPWT